MSSTVALPAELLAAAHGVSVDRMLAALEQAERAGLVEQDNDGRWHATDRGRRWSDLLLSLDDELKENAA